MPAPLHQDAMTWLSQQGVTSPRADDLNRAMNFLAENPDKRPSYSADGVGEGRDAPVSTQLTEPMPLTPIETRPLDDLTGETTQQQEVPSAPVPQRRPANNGQSPTRAELFVPEPSNNAPQQQTSYPQLYQQAREEQRANDPLDSMIDSLIARLLGSISDGT